MAVNLVVAVLGGMEHRQFELKLVNVEPPRSSERHRFWTAPMPLVQPQLFGLKGRRETSNFSG